MEIKILQTGSSGNCVIVDGYLALDMGVSWKKLAPYVPRLQVVFISHVHSDHCRIPTIRQLARTRPGVRFVGGEHMAGAFTRAGVRAGQIDILQPGYWSDYGPFGLSTVPLVHDVENYGLKVNRGGERLFYAVDTGTLDDIRVKGYDYLLIEANYGEEEIRERIARKEAAGEYAYEHNVPGRHLSQEQALAWIAKNAGPHTQYVLLHEHMER